MAPKKLSVPALRARKHDGKRIVMVAAYDALFARMADDSGVDIVLVGASVGTCRALTPGVSVGKAAIAPPRGSCGASNSTLATKLCICAEEHPTTAITTMIRIGSNRFIVNTPYRSTMNSTINWQLY